jgi:acyl-CoA synthetase (AMP-forming)/AMP-acid ligase II
LPSGDARCNTYAEFLDRSRRLARFLGDHSLGAYLGRNLLRGHESGQHFLAQYLYNGPAYLEGLAGAFRGRLAPPVGHGRRTPARPPTPLAAAHAGDTVRLAAIHSAFVASQLPVSAGT